MPNLSKNKALQTVDLSRNPIFNVSDQSFAGPEKLQQLILNNVSIVEISPGTLGNVGNIKLLDLSNNYMTKMPSRVSSLQS